MQLVSFDENDTWEFKKGLAKLAGADHVSLNYIITRHSYAGVLNHNEKFQYLWSLGARPSMEKIIGCVGNHVLDFEYSVSHLPYGSSYCPHHDSLQLLMNLDPEGFFFESMTETAAADVVLKRMVQDPNMRKKFLRNYLVGADSEKYQRTRRASMFCKNHVLI
jgi:hypothetical protein